MHKIKAPALLLIAILIGGIFSSATAQKKLPFNIDPPIIGGLNGSYQVDVRADILSRGEVEFRTPDTFGWTCYGTTEGDLTGYMFVSMNFSGSTPMPFGGEIRNVTGGSWSKLIFVDGVYAGSIYGRIVSGQLISATVGIISDVAPSNTTTMSLQLVGDGGTGDYAVNVGSGSFEGVIDESARGTSVFGRLSLNY